MAPTYSTYEAKARFSEILRRVRSGQPVTISYRGVAVAEIRPVYNTEDAERVVKQMEEEGTLSPAAAPLGDLVPISRKRGALKRFLEDRE